MLQFSSHNKLLKNLSKRYIFWKKKTNPEKTHNLVKIALDLKTPKNISSALEELTPAAVLTLYADVLGMAPVQFYTLEKAKKSLKLAEEVLLWVNQQLK